MGKTVGYSNTPLLAATQAEYQEKFGPGDYRPNLFVTYWAFRAMIGFLLIPVAFALAALWLLKCFESF